jgi:hypothetical protein
MHSVPPPHRGREGPRGQARGVGAADRRLAEVQVRRVRQDRGAGPGRRAPGAGDAARPAAARLHHRDHIANVRGHARRRRRGRRVLATHGHARRGRGASARSVWRACVYFYSRAQPEFGIPPQKGLQGGDAAALARCPLPTSRGLVASPAGSTRACAERRGGAEGLTS